MRVAFAAIAALLLALPLGSAAAAPTPDPVDCTGPPAQAAPDTPAWHQREAQEAWCGEQRVRDTAANPLFHAAGLQMVVRNGGILEEDPLRDPALLGGTRFRYEKV